MAQKVPSAAGDHETAYGTFLVYGWAMARRPPSARSSRVLRVHILALRDSTALVPIGLADMLRKAMEVAATIPTARPRPILEPKLVACGPGRIVSGAGGLRVH